MKIGILTFHRAHNYGAVLQCYAMQEILKNLGHDVFVVDYYQPYVEYAYRVFCWKNILRYIKHHDIRGFYSYIMDIPMRLKRRHNFELFRLNLNLSSSCDSVTNVPSDFDVFIMGSDQIWNIYQTGNVLDRVYWGDFPSLSSVKKIAYAVSMSERGVALIPQETIKRILSSFQSVSFREKKISEIVGTILGKECPTCLDPTLLTTASTWEALINNKWVNRKYILTYFITPNTSMVKKIEVFARMQGLEIIHLFPMRYSVEDFVSLFKYATFVIGTSFHGTAFSLIFHRPFFSVTSGHVGDDRYISLLTKIGLSNNLLPQQNDISYPPLINWELVDTKLESMRAMSLNYLEKNITSV